jgi:predicted Zn-dependent protease
MKAIASFVKIAGICLLAGSVLALRGVAAQNQTRADAEKDPVLKAMLEEMARSMSDLQLKGFAKPFFIQYRIDDVDDFNTRAEFGASEGSSSAHQRVIRVTVRVGDYKTDSSGGRADGSLAIAGLENDPLAIRTALWDATDSAYKNALAAYAQKQAALKQVQSQPQADDFSQEKPVIALAPPEALTIDEAAWSKRMAQASGIYRTNPAVKANKQIVQYSNGTFHARVTTTYLVSSEGAIVRKVEHQYEESIAVGTQADDGMHLDRSYSSTANSLADLDSPEVFEKHALEDIASLDTLRKAPVVEEEYHGPVLLSADAATDTLRALLANSVIATRPQLGTEARTNGPFASSYHARVMPDFVDVVDDPGLKNYNGKGLLGAYDYDDEGIPEQQVSLVADGKLMSYLIGRQPVKDFIQSNGHGRAGVTGAPRPVIGVLKISATTALSEDELNHKLSDMMKDRGLKSAYYVETLGGAGNPRLLYRINADGSRGLVRGAELADIDQRALRSGVAAAGKELDVANYFGDVPQTVLAPALLLDDVTVKRANSRNDKLPYYPPPE